MVWAESVQENIRRIKIKTLVFMAIEVKVYHYLQLDISQISFVLWDGSPMTDDRSRRKRQSIEILNPQINLLA